MKLPGFSKVNRREALCGRIWTPESGPVAVFFFLIFIYLCINLTVSYCVQDLFIMAC